MAGDSQGGASGGAGHGGTMGRSGAPGSGSAGLASSGATHVGGGGFGAASGFGASSGFTFGGFGAVGGAFGGAGFGAIGGGGAGAIGGDAGSGATGGIVDACVAVANSVCDQCLCKTCAPQLESCFSDLGCALIFACAQQTGCQSFGCYSPNTCRPIIDKFGGLQSSSMSKVFGLFGCAVTSQQACGCN